MENKVKSFINAFFLSFSFLTRIPVKFSEVSYKTYDFKKVIIFFPLVGGMVGVLNLLILGLFKTVFPDEIVILLILFFQYLLFNLFHFDGFLDFFEAILSGKTAKEEIFKIMKDPHIGSFALFIGIFYFFLKFYLLKEVLNFPVVFYLYPITGRISQVTLMYFLKPAKKDGLGALFKDIPYAYFLTSWVFVLLLFLPLFQATLILLFSIFFTMIFMGVCAMYKLGGFTGDVVGATNEVGELFFIFSFFLLYGIIQKT